MTEDERDWCIGLQVQARNWWTRSQHHIKMCETAKNWDSYEYARIHAAIDQNYAALAYARALELLDAQQLDQAPHDLLETSSAKPAKPDAIRVTEIMMGIGNQPDQTEHNRLALKLARARGAP